MTAKKKRQRRKRVENITHLKARRRHIPSAEHEPVLSPRDSDPVRVEFERRNRDLDPQLVWREKGELDDAEIGVDAPLLFIEERIQPKLIVDELQRHTEARRESEEDTEPTAQSLWGDFNGVPAGSRTEFYQHEANWSNRMILGDSLQVMASLAEREGLRGRVQCVYVDPPYGVRFGSNFQWSTTTREVEDGKRKHITRQPEQVRAFRDTWRLGIHSYLSYLRDRLTLVRELLTESGSVFVQIGAENVHRVRAVMDEVFGPENFVNTISCRVSSGTRRARGVRRTSDHILWYARDGDQVKSRRLLRTAGVDTRSYNQVEEVNGLRRPMTTAERRDPSRLPERARPFRKLPLYAQQSGDNAPRKAFGNIWEIPDSRHWRHKCQGFRRLVKAGRVSPDKTALCSLLFRDDYPASDIEDIWVDTGPEINKSFVVQTSPRVIERCLLLSSDPGDLVLDPTCGSGTTAFAAEKWGRRWITIDTSRVALALARARIMGGKFPFYLLADTSEGRAKEAEISGEFTGTGVAGYPPPPESGDGVLGPNLTGHPAGVRLRAGTTHHPESDRRQLRSRGDLGALAA